MTILSFILVDETVARFGYHPDTLKPNSQKSVYVECPSCADIRTIQWRTFAIRGCSGLCHICASGSDPYRTEEEKVQRDRDLALEYYYKHKPMIMALKRQRRKTDERYRLITNLRKNIRTIMVRKSITANGSLRHLGYTASEFIEHINHRLAFHDFKCPECGCELYQYHIDHKMPVSIAGTFEEIIAAFALKNLDVLCPKCNQKKSNKFVEEKLEK